MRNIQSTLLTTFTIAVFTALTARLAPARQCAATSRAHVIAELCRDGVRSLVQAENIKVKAVEAMTRLANGKKLRLVIIQPMAPDLSALPWITARSAGITAKGKN